MNGLILPRGLIMPIIIALFLPFALGGNALGAIMPIILYTGVTILIGYYLCIKGYVIGKNSILQLLQDGKVKDLIDGASVLGLFMMGALSASYIKIETPFKIAIANSQPIMIQEILNSIAPGILELAAVFGIYWFLKKKGPRYNIIMISIIVFSIVCSLLGLL